MSKPIYFSISFTLIGDLAKYKAKNKFEGNTIFKFKNPIVIMHFKVIGHRLYTLVNHQIYENEFMKEEQEALSSSFKTLKRVVINSIGY